MDATYIDAARSQWRQWNDALDEAARWDHDCVVHRSTATGLWCVNYCGDVNNVELIEC